MSQSGTLTNKEIKRKKSTQAKLSSASGALALGSLGVIGASALARKKPKLFKIKPNQAGKVADAIKDKGYIIGSTGAGVGALGSLNFAQISRAEANKNIRKQMSDKEKDALTYTGIGATSAAVTDAGIRRYKEPKPKNRLLKTLTRTKRGKVGLAVGATGLGVAGLNESTRYRYKPYPSYFDKM